MIATPPPTRLRWRRPSRPPLVPLLRLRVGLAGVRAPGSGARHHDNQAPAATPTASA